MLKDKVNEFQKKLEDFQNQYKTEGQKILKELIKEFFEKHPEFFGIAFVGYTPYFNDGEPCTYSVGEVEFLIKASAATEFKEKIDENLDYIDAYENMINDNDDFDGYGTSIFGFTEIGSEELKNNVNTISKFISGNEDLIKNLFGDDQVILITKDEVRQEYYAHD